MTRFGYFLSSEEFRPGELLDQARMAEEAGFEALWISDHFHPWTEEQGEGPFVWSVIGALSQVCRLPVTTGHFQGPPLHRRARADLLAARAATGGLHLRVRPEVDRARRPHR